MTKAFLDSMDSSSVTNAARVIELSCTMFLLLSDEVASIKKMIETMDYKISKQMIADRVSEFLETLFWFKHFLGRTQTSVLAQAIPKALILHKELFSELCNEILHVEVKSQYSDYTITSAGTGRLSGLCKTLGKIMERQLLGCYLKSTVQGITVIPPCNVMVHSLSEMLGSEELAAQKELLDLTLLTLSGTTLTIKEASVNATAAKIVLPRLAKWKRITFEECIFDFDAMFNTLTWSQTEFKGDIDFNRCTLPNMLEQNIRSRNIHIMYCKWV